MTMDATTSKRRLLGGRRRWLAGVSAAAVLLLIGVTAVSAAPSNDAFARAQRMSPFMVVSGGNEGATTQPGEPLPCGSMGSTVWFWMDSPGGHLSFDTTGSSYDTVVAVYRVGDGRGFSGLTELECNDDGFRTGLNSFGTFDSRRGEKLLIQVGGYEGEQGAFKLVVGRP